MDFRDQAPVVQRPDNFIQWISVFPLVQANVHTDLPTAKSGTGSVRKPWITFNVKYILDPE